MWSKLKNIQVFYSTILTHKKLRGILIFVKMEIIYRQTC
jgi:hypothetical protein